jgi:hypothetical protein
VTPDPDALLDPLSGDPDGAGSVDPLQQSREEVDGRFEVIWGRLRAQTDQIEQLRARIGELEADAESAKTSLAPWLTYEPPPAAEDAAHRGQTPLFTIAHFVHYYNETYVGKPGTRAVAIPDCWLSHPGLLAELATLTYTWRDAHIGKHATVKEAQYWHDRWRPGFAERLITEWTHSHCLTEVHKPVGAAARIDRYTPEQQDGETHDALANPHDIPRKPEPDAHHANRGPEDAAP